MDVPSFKFPQWAIKNAYWFVYQSACWPVKVIQGRCFTYWSAKSAVQLLVSVKWHLSSFLEYGDLGRPTGWKSLFLFSPKFEVDDWLYACKERIYLANMLNSCNWPSFWDNSTYTTSIGYISVSLHRQTGGQTDNTQWHYPPVQQPRGGNRSRMDSYPWTRGKWNDN